MQDIPDKDLDELFKQAAFYQRPPETVEIGWNAMQKKLDESWIIQVRQKVKIYIVVEGALLVCIFLLLFISPFGNQNKVIVNNKLNKPLIVSTIKINKNVELSDNYNRTYGDNYKNKVEKNENIKIPYHKKQDSVTNENTKNRIINQRSLTVNTITNDNKSKIHIASEIAESDFQKYKIFNKNLDRNNTLSFVKLNNYSGQDFNTSHHRDKTDLSPYSNSKISFLKMKNPAGMQDTIFNINKKVRIIIDTIPVLAKEKKKVYRFNITFLTSPDLSFTGLKNIGSVGSNIGIELGYSLSKRWSINTGIIYSKKVYSAQPSDYHPPEGYWTNNQAINLHSIKANCHVIDIPLTIKYNFIMKGKYNLYATTGLSTYIMKTESYNYDYSYNNNSVTYKKDWDIANQNSHYFSIGNLSIGYERKINKRLSLQAEPFVKLPISGIGYGKVKLISSGLFLSVKYNLR